ncbi:DUF4296 domain-containing protein [Rubrolithibacter danxiaensis]|uniref:DUF4296 domain-containing protein n=1 Tax=Rubrolithibacter danxiaensis TaxID=3390805 RepID=UPI003BF87182
MNRLIPLLLLLFFFQSCSDTVPNGIIAKEKMVNALTDIHLADGYVNSVPPDSARNVTPVLYQSIYKKYNTDSAGFAQSLKYYTKSNELKDMYLIVQKKLDSLQKKEEKEAEKMRLKLEKEEKEKQKKAEQDAKRKADSIKKDKEQKRLQKIFNKKKIMSQDSAKKPGAKK